jgi:hypothetical protein
LKIFHSQEILIFIKYFLEKEYSLSHHITKDKNIKRKYSHHLSLTTPSHTTKKLIPWKIEKIPPSYFEKQPNFSLPCHPKKNLWVSPHPKKHSPLLIPPLERGEITPSSPLHQKKNPFGKEKNSLKPLIPFF